MIRVVCKRAFCTLPTKTMVQESKLTVDQSVPRSLNIAAKKILQRVKEQNKIIHSEYHRNLDLNFAQMQDGKIPIIIAQPTFKWLAQKLNIHTFASLAMVGLIPWMPSIYFAGASFGYLAWAIRSQVTTLVEHFSPKIITIYLLENGNLQILARKGRSFVTFEIPKSEFKYGTGYNGSGSSLRNSEMTSSGIWCTIQGQHFFLADNTLVNQHLLHEIQ